MYVSFLLDVEDIISPEADDIAAECARLLTDEGIQATFCVVGERVRQWVQRDRRDVLEALGQHDLGSHTDYHSFHPTIVEYLWDKGWADGVETALRQETPAFAAIEHVWGRRPSCWGGPGNTWGPQINGAMARLGGASVVYAHTRAPAGDIHTFEGVFAYPDGLHAGDSQYEDVAASEANRARLAASLLANRDAGVQWAQVFLGHPSRILHHAFWDGIPFAGGRNPTGYLPSDPASAQGVATPRRKSADELATALESLRLAALSVRDLPGVELRTIREMNELAAAGEQKPLTDAEITAIWPEIERNVRSMANWVILPRDIHLDGIVQLTYDRLHTLRRVVLA